MEIKAPIAVCGLMRSGTSLMMQILNACGKNALGEYPYFECMEATPHEPLKDKWLDTLDEDDCFKWLECPATCP